jgi:hypothetical protein
MLVVAALESPAVIAGLDDVAMMGQPVEQRGRPLGVAEHAGPFTEGEIGGDDDGGALTTQPRRSPKSRHKNLRIAVFSGLEYTRMAQD